MAKKANGDHSLPALKGRELPAKFDDLGIQHLRRTKNQEIAAALKIAYDKSPEVREYVATISNDDAKEGSWRTDHDFLGKELRDAARAHQGFGWLRTATAHEIACQWRAYTKAHAPTLHRLARLTEAVEMARMTGPNGEPFEHDPGTA